MPNYGAHDHETKMAYVEWYATPQSERAPSTRAQWSLDFGVPERTLTSWVKQPWFKERLEAVYGTLNVSPDRLQQVVDSMFNAALTGNTKAAELYLRYVERISPARVIVEDKRVESMTTEELTAALTLAAEEVGRLTV